jgi:hypothetical protein
VLVTPSNFGASALDRLAAAIEQRSDSPAPTMRVPTELVIRASSGSTQPT